MLQINRKNRSRGRLLLPLVSAAFAASAVHASTLSYTGGTYTQNFDSLPNPGALSVNTANPVTIPMTTGTTYYLQSPIFDFANPVDSTGNGNASTVSNSGGLGLAGTMSGWYGGAATAVKLGATFGDQTTGGDLSFGPASSTNRALGLIATGTTGATYFGLDIVNNTTKPIAYINLSFTGEQWKQGTLQKTLSIGYTVDNSNSLNVVTAATASTQLAAITNPTTGTVAAVDGTLPANQTPVNITNFTLGTPLAVGGSLWITGQIANAGGSGQGFGIDNLSFSSASTPEPASISLLGITALGLLGRRRASR